MPPEFIDKHFVNEHFDEMISGNNSNISSCILNEKIKIIISKKQIRIFDTDKNRLESTPVATPDETPNQSPMITPVASQEQEAQEAANQILSEMKSPRYVLIL